MKKILILNGSHSEIPLVLAAKDLGLYVITTGNRPDLIGHTLSDEYHAVDYSDKDEVLSLGKRLQIDYICSCANDAGIITAAYVAEKLGLPGFDSYENTLILHLKDRFKQFCKNKPIPTPKAFAAKNKQEAILALENLTLPLIIKPTDMAGGKGVRKVENLAEVEKAINIAFYMSPSSRIVLEEFIVGSQHSFSTFIIDEKVKAYFSDNEFSSVNPYTVSTSSYPADQIELVEDTLINTSEFIAHELKLKNGVLHHQYILCNGKPYIIEITRRCSGDLYPIPIKNSLGFFWAQWIVKMSMGHDGNAFPNSVQNGFGGRHCLQANRNGIIKSYEISDELRQYITEEYTILKPGGVVTDYLYQKLVVIILQFPDLETRNQITKNLANLAKVVVSDKSLS